MRQGGRTGMQWLWRCLDLTCIRHSSLALARVDGRRSKCRLAHHPFTVASPALGSPSWYYIVIWVDRVNLNNILPGLMCHTPIIQRQPSRCIGEPSTSTYTYPTSYARSSKEKKYFVYIILFCHNKKYVKQKPVKSEGWFLWWKLKK